MSAPLQSIRSLPHTAPGGPLIELVYIDAGGGHRSAATALQNVIEDHYPHWRVRLTNLFQDVLRPLDPVHRLTGKHRTEDTYNRIVKLGLTYGFSLMLKGTRKLIKFYNPEIEELLRVYWRDNEPPDLLVSLIPHFNGTMFRALGDVHPEVPYVTVMTDLADCPPHFWQEKQDQYLICGSDKALRQAQRTGYRKERVFKTSGMILKPHFYEKECGARRKARRALGLDPDLPIALIMFGGNGADTAGKIFHRLEKLKSRVQSIVLCGRNEELRKELESRQGCHAVGFTDRVPHYMRLADFFIGKPGPGSLSEALHMGLPVIVESNRRTMPQERYNVEWVKKQGVGLAIGSFSEIDKAVERLLRGERLTRFRRNARRLDNRAVYEIPALFERIMDRRLY